MERNVFGRLIGGVLGLSSLGALGALGVVFGGGPTPPLPGKSEGEWRLLEPVRYENLSIFPVVSARAYDTSWFLTLDEGLASGEVQVREQGSEGMARSRDGVVRPADSNGASVNQLVLINRSKRPLLLLAGELVSGGKQDRIIGKDRLVPVGSKPLPLDVFCVEHGRVVVWRELYGCEDDCAPERAGAGDLPEGSGACVECGAKRNDGGGDCVCGRGKVGGAQNRSHDSRRGADRVLPENL